MLETIQLEKGARRLGHKLGRRQLPCFSGVVSISSVEMPNDLQYSTCSFISRKMCVTISLD